jgi:hypothetical protein
VLAEKSIRAIGQLPQDRPEPGTRGGWTSRPAQADGRVAALSDAQLARLRAAGGPVDLRQAFNVARAHHRQEHLDEIEHALRA